MLDLQCISSREKDLPYRCLRARHCSDYRYVPARCVANLPAGKVGRLRIIGRELPFQVLDETTAAGDIAPAKKVCTFIQALYDLAVRGAHKVSQGRLWFTRTNGRLQIRRPSRIAVDANPWNQSTTYQRERDFRNKTAGTTSNKKLFRPAIHLGMRLPVGLCFFELLAVRLIFVFVCKNKMRFPEIQDILDTQSGMRNVLAMIGI